MDDLVAWLRAQLDEDEKVARLAAPGPWEYQDVDSVGGGRVCDPTVAIADMHYDTDRVDSRIRRSVSAQEADGSGEHIARHDPAQVLREVEAKRRILDRHRYSGYPDPDMSHGDVEICGYCEVRWPCPDIVDQSLPYADQPGYRDEWKL